MINGVAMRAYRRCSLFYGIINYTIRFSLLRNLLEIAAILDNPEVDVSTESCVSTSESRKHLAKNTTANIVFFLFNAITSIFMVPYQRNHLGVADYGMVTLANSFVTYTQILSMALVGTVYRFVTLHLARNEMNEARSYLNTQFIAVVTFVLAFLPIAVSISIFVPSFIRVPPGQEDNTRLLFGLVYLSFLLAMLCSSYQVAQFARQRFDIRYTVEMGGQVIRYSLWMLLFAAFTPVLWHIGIGYVVGALFVLIATIISSRNYCLMFFHLYMDLILPNLKTCPEWGLGLLLTRSE